MRKELEKRATRLPTEDSKGTGKQTLTFWLLLADCINGAYWKKRGFTEVRRSTVGEGTWGCKTSFDMVTARKDVPLDATTVGELDSGGV